MRSVKIELKSFDQLRELNSIVKSLFAKTEFEGEDLIDLLNLRDLQKKMDDKMYTYQNKRVKKISLNIEINHFRSLRALFDISDCILKEQALIYHKLLLMEVIEQGINSFDKQYLFEIINLKEIS